MCKNVSLRVIHTCILSFALVIGQLGCNSTTAERIENAAGVVTTPTISLLGSDKQFVKEAGWKVPSKKNTQTGSKISEKIESANDKTVEVDSTYFTPKDPITFSEEVPEESRLHGELQLIHFEEYRVGKKTYLYRLTVVKTEESSKVADNRYIPPFNYVILDKDGDGVFETLIDGRNTPPPPAWVVTP